MMLPAEFEIKHFFQYFFPFFFHIQHWMWIPQIQNGSKMQVSLYVASSLALTDPQHNTMNENRLA